MSPDWRDVPTIVCSFVLASVILSSFLVIPNPAIYAQYGEGSGKQPTQSQLEECKQLGISEWQCSEDVITAKKRVLAAHSVKAQYAQQIITFASTSTGDIDKKTYDAKITWTVADIGQPSKFHVEIFDANQLEPRSPKAVSYDFKIYEGDKYLLPQQETRNDDFSRDYTFTFLQEGSRILAIEEIEHEGENIKIPIQVTPEFPVGLLVVVAGLLASIIAITRMSLVQPNGKR